MIRIYLAALALAACQSCFAQDFFPSRGAGTESCGKYLEARPNEEYGSRVVQWVWGYLTAYDQYSDLPDVTPPDKGTVLAYLDKHCRDHPLNGLTQAVMALVADLRKQ